MKKVTKTFNVFSFDELAESIQTSLKEEAIDYIVQYEVSAIWDEDGNVEPRHRNSKLYKAFKDCERYRTPWFIGSYIWDYMEKEIMQTLRSKAYLITGNLFVEDN